MTTMTTEERTSTTETTKQSVHSRLVVVVQNNSFPIIFLKAWEYQCLGLFLTNTTSCVLYNSKVDILMPIFQIRKLSLVEIRRFA